MVDRSILNVISIRYTPQTNLSANKENEKLLVDIPREDSVIPLKDRFLELDFITKPDADEDARYASNSIKNIS